MSFFPGHVWPIPETGANAHIRASRRIKALAEDPARHPHRLVLWTDASKVGSDGGVPRVGLAVAWQEYNERIGRWEWKEKTWLLRVDDDGKKEATRAEFEAISRTISDALGDIIVSYERSLPHTVAVTEVTIYSDCDDAVQFIKHPEKFWVKSKPAFASARRSLETMNAEAWFMSYLGISIEINWIPSGHDKIGIPGNVWADCSARRATGYRTANGKETTFPETLQWLKTVEARKHPGQKELWHWHWYDMEFNAIYQARGVPARRFDGKCLHLKAAEV
ncbi:hypothetical protein NpNSSI1_00012306 [Neofusicoccum parvum]|nr:hypothetical protein NpNSSI1_00012306 [Neofusicoccum parvum]